MNYTYHNTTKEITKFAIISTRRSGSTFLCVLLDSHPQIICHQEIFPPGGTFFSGSIPALSEPTFSLAKRNAQPVKFLNEVWKYRTHESESIGFKILEDQNEHVLHHIIHDPNIRIIILRRRDSLASFVSLKIAESTDIWNSYAALKKSPKKARPDSMRINPDEFKKYMNEQNNFFDKVINRLLHAGKHFEMLEYEDLQNQPVWADKILKFLGVKINVKLRSDLVKQGDYELKHFILNYAEIDKLRFSGNY